MKQLHAWTPIVYREGLTVGGITEGVPERLAAEASEDAAKAAAFAALRSDPGVIAFSWEPAGH